MSVINSLHTRQILEYTQHFEWLGFKARDPFHSSRDTCKLSENRVSSSLIRSIQKFANLWSIDELRTKTAVVMRLKVSLINCSLYKNIFAAEDSIDINGYT